MRRLEVPSTELQSVGTKCERLGVATKCNSRGRSLNINTDNTADEEPADGDKQGGEADGDHAVDGFEEGNHHARLDEGHDRTE